jgi:hypothetical protein
MCLESFLLSGEKSLNIVQAIHHLVELRFHAIPWRLPSFVCTPLDTLVRKTCVPLDTNALTLEERRSIRKPRTKGAFGRPPVQKLRNVRLFSAFCRTGLDPLEKKC